MRYGRFRPKYVERSRWRRAFDWCLTISIFALLVLCIVRLDDLSAKKAEGLPTIVDGDSLVLAGQKLRLMGIDAPEYLQTCKIGANNYPCGREARRYLDALINKQSVICEGWQRDKYNRLLVTCVAQGKQINRTMVDAGWALAYGEYFAEESAAKAAKRGIWRGEFERPSRWRQMKGDIIEVPHDTWLKIVSFFRNLFGI